jgi:hypothetical protein
MQAESPSEQIFNAVAVSSTNTYYSGSTTIGPRSVPGNAIGSDVNGSMSVSQIGQFTGTPNGTLTIQVSNASRDQVMAGTDLWDTDDSYSGGGFTAGVATVTSGQINGSAVFKIKGVCRYRRMRLKYTNSSGSGTISVDQTIKRL